MSQLVLDAGAFIAFERGDVRVRQLLLAAEALDDTLVTVSPVVSQVWRDGVRQALLARILRGVDVRAPAQPAARAAGELLRKTGTSDVVDALLAGVARHGDTLLTSDPHDLSALLSAARIRATLVKV